MIRRVFFNETNLLHKWWVKDSFNSAAVCLTRYKWATIYMLNLLKFLFFFYFLGIGRKQRFEKISKDLKVTRVFSTLVEEMKAIGCVPNVLEPKVTEVMVPVAHSERSPVLLLMGGGMGAGKSTVLKDILKEYST